jgi:hypothetical protein
MKPMLRNYVPPNRAIGGLTDGGLSPCESPASLVRAIRTFKTHLSYDLSDVKPKGQQKAAEGCILFPLSQAHRPRERWAPLAARLAELRHSFPAGP